VPGRYETVFVIRGLFMIASFFRHLEQHGVRWLLISGQATILYGAATFSEDVDLWVQPTEHNFERFKAALHESQARYYKLTPALTVANAADRHGFHFVLPSPEDNLEVFLDVMGFPPRVGSFDDAFAASRDIETRWGNLHTIGIKDLVELKKTQRPRDYPIISRLALAWFDERAAAASAEDLAWVFENLFSLEELVRLCLEHPAQVKKFLPAAPEPLVRAAELMLKDGRLEPSLEDELEEWLDQRTLPMRRADRHFWRTVIDSLRELRAGGQLMPEGAPVES
jgi:hypothetical protein